MGIDAKISGDVWPARRGFFKNDHHIKLHKTPAILKQVLTKDTNVPIRKQDWDCQSAIGMLNYLAGCTQPDILFATHQCARFSSDPKFSHENAVKRITWYLTGNYTKGIILKPNKNSSICDFVDASFASGWSQEDSQDPTNIWTGYMLNYADCPFLWVSKLQMEIALLTSKAKYITLLQSLRDVILFMTLHDKIRDIFNLKFSKPVI